MPPIDLGPPPANTAFSAADNLNEHTMPPRIIHQFSSSSSVGGTICVVPPIFFAPFTTHCEPSAPNHA